MGLIDWIVCDVKVLPLGLEVGSFLFLLDAVRKTNLH